MRDRPLPEIAKTLDIALPGEDRRELDEHARGGGELAQPDAVRNRRNDAAAKTRLRFARSPGHRQREGRTSVSSEQDLALTLRDEIPGGSLVIVDRGLTALNLERAGSHWPRRASTDNVWTVTKKLSPTDHLIEMKVSSGARRGKDRSLWSTSDVRSTRTSFPCL